MVKAVLERGLAAELTEHLGYERGDPAGRGSPNSRNGTTPKTLATEVGDVPPAVPRDATPPVACVLPCAQRTNAVLLVDQQADLYVAGPCIRTEVSTRVAMSWARVQFG
jgi:putative transposase